MDESKILKIIAEGTFIGVSRIDGLPVYKVWLGNTPQTKGLDSDVVKYDKKNNVLHRITQYNHLAT